MLSSRIPTVLPSLTFDEALEVTKIYSVPASCPRSSPWWSPVRSAHRTTQPSPTPGSSAAASTPRPGELSLAHRGVLFLDELPEFKKHVLEVLRQPWKRAG
jgi:magnesium chelatase family protein